MRFANLDRLRSARADAGRLYEEFLRAPSMSVGLYELPAGATDPQQPHTEDELYVVLGGRARFTCGSDVGEVVVGDVIFVEARTPHRFHDIVEDLSLLVVFAPATSG